MQSIMQREFGGFPFVDTGFMPGRLMAAAAMCRWSIVHPHERPPTPDALSALLDPAEAKRIRGLNYTLDLPHGTLTGEQQLQIAQGRQHIAALLPDWEELINLPLCFVELRHSEAISSSNFAWPQHIFLAPRAFTTPATLVEQILHEISHQWMYLVEEMFPLQIDAPERRFILPSGTAGRSATELLGAAHVVANLQRMWPLLPVENEQRRSRLDHLARYGAGGADLLETAADVLTAEGQALASRLIEEIRKS